MNEPLYLTLHHPDDKAAVSFVGETHLDHATIETQAKLQNRLASAGNTETLVAARPIYWQRRLVKALLFGFALGAFCAICGFLLL